MNKLFSLAIIAGIGWLLISALRNKNLGDLNDDGIVDNMDILILQYYIAGYPIKSISPLSDAEFIKRADINKDGVINSRDITALELIVGG